MLHNSTCSNCTCELKLWKPSQFPPAASIHSVVIFWKPTNFNILYSFTYANSWKKKENVVFIEYYWKIKFSGRVGTWARGHIHRRKVRNQWSVTSSKTTLLSRFSLPPEIKWSRWTNLQSYWLVIGGARITSTSNCCKLFTNTENLHQEILDYLVMTIWSWSIPNSEYGLRETEVTPAV
jgi:hypothetical protein